MVAEHRSQRGPPPAVGRWRMRVPVAFSTISIGEMRGAVKPARGIDDLARPLLGVVDQLLKFFQGWLALTNSIEGSAETSAIGANCRA